MLNTAEQFYITKHANADLEESLDVETLIAALGKKKVTDAFRIEVTKFRSETLTKRAKQEALGQVTLPSAGGKRQITAMTMAGSMQPATGEVLKDGVPSKALKGCVHNPKPV